ncbi:NUDIX hydrolase [Jannaschia ovalis]|uniref:NUDIX hydrolase n=1 Tax=Jannaschia ovalis TaxID=3038773 RepID=A0ABY8L7M5_9RHOB|nr:NUDIX hydrolase [Jannaschia sp. GRR-S6-38]WGH77378.1 NUDIX hydrolase [Jannaschia sp. GRR-S6-38]
MLPVFGPPPRPAQRWRHRPGAYAVLIRNGRVLVTEQDDGTTVEIQLPGGGIDPGESPLPALAREVLEETGHSCRILRHLGSFRRFTFMPDYGFHAEKLCHVFLGRPGLRLGPPREAGHRGLWLTPQAALARLANAGDAAMLARAIR